MIFVIFGGGGVGKGTLANRLQAADPELWLSRSWTTRARRPGEAEDAYVFVDAADFQKRIEEGGFLEWVEYLPGQWSGTPWPQDAPPGADILLEIDPVGAANVKHLMPDAVAILVVPPSRDVQEERLRSRGDPPDKIARRLAKSEDEERLGRELADHVVVNDDLSRAVAEVAGILDRYRKRVSGD